MMPDYLTENINYCILLELIGCEFDISLLEPYSEYSAFLEFMLNPKNFDYSKVNIDNYMWQNLIYSPKYKRYFLEHKNELLSSTLKNIFMRNADSRGQQKVVYGLLLNENELKEFPREKAQSQNDIH